VEFFAVLGHPISHSLSPALHTAAFEALEIDAAFLALDCPPERFPLTLDALFAWKARGLSVTAPLKEAAFSACSRRTPEALEAGTANCLRWSEGGYEATNTDGIGFVDFAGALGLGLEGRQVILLGGGGAAAGIAPALMRAGAHVEVVARRPDAARARAGLSRLVIHPWEGEADPSVLRGADLVVNCTPLGGEEIDPLPCDPKAMAPGAVAIDLRYAPPRTPWLRALAQSGRIAFGGLGLLVHQGAHSLRYWLGVEPPLDRLREAVGWELEPIRPDAS
jgi:shikimate dehydrogenase